MYFNMSEMVLSFFLMNFKKEPKYKQKADNIGSIFHGF